MAFVAPPEAWRGSSFTVVGRSGFNPLVRSAGLDLTLVLLDLCPAALTRAFAPVNRAGKKTFELEPWLPSVAS